VRALLLAAALLPGATYGRPDTITVTSARGERRVAVRDERGFPAVAAADLAAVLSVEPVASPPGTATLRVTGQTFAFVLGAGYFRHNDHVYTLAAGPYLAADSLFVPLQFVTEYLPRLTGRYRYDPATQRLEEIADPSVTAAAPRASAATRVAAGTVAAPRRRMIAIDAGHGGVDAGMSGPIGSSPFLKEKDVTLGIARALQRELQRRGYATVMTRDDDTLIALGDRGRIAGRAHADIFVSIHVNSVPGRSQRSREARGFETYYLAEARTEDARRVARMENASVRFETSATAPRGDPLAFILNDLAQNEHLRESSRLAGLVQTSLAAVHPSDSRGVKQAPFWVLSTSYMPAILVETGFGTNPQEARYLVSGRGQRELAAALADGIDRYMAEYERRLAAGAP